MHKFHKFILAWNSTCFGQFLCPLSGVYSLYTQHWYMSYSFWAGPGGNCSSILVLLESWLQTCMTYTIAECTVNKLLMMDRELSETYRVSCQNKIYKISSWFYYKEICYDARSHERKIRQCQTVKTFT